MSKEESEDELFDIPQENVQLFSSPFAYNDHLLFPGVLRAVVENNLQKVKSLIEKGRSPSIHDNHGNTPLHIAVINHLSDIVAYLLSLGDDIVDRRNFYGETPLFLAVGRGHLDLVQALVEAKADVNVPNSEDVTPLHKAAHNPHIVHLLIQNGANVNAKDFDGETPLHAAICHTSSDLEQSLCEEVVCMLLFYNADANIECNGGRTPFLKAMFLHRDDLQSILIDHIVDFDASIHGGMTTLGWALVHGSPFVQQILEAGASVNYKSSSGNAIISCLQTPTIRTFSLVWQRFKYQSLDDGKTFLELLNDHLQDEELFQYIQVIIDSNNLEPIFKHFNFNPLFRVLDQAGDVQQSWLNTALDLVYLYLCEGHVLEYPLLFQVFQLFGYNELFYVLLHMDFHYERIASALIPFILYQPNVPMDVFKKYVIFRLLRNGLVKIKEYLPYIRLLPDANEDRSLTPIEDDLQLLTQIPSLLELARNAARDHLASKFQLNTSKKYVCFIKTLPVHTLCKEILIFRRPVYLFDN